MVIAITFQGSKAMNMLTKTTLAAVMLAAMESSKRWPTNFPTPYVSPAAIR